VAKATKDIAASLRARLLNMARASGRDFYTNRDKEAQWKAFLQRSRLALFPTFPEAMARLMVFLEPVCSSTAMNNAIWNPADWNWKTGP
jgi:hypothetical protein